MKISEGFLFKGAFATSIKPPQFVILNAVKNLLSKLEDD